MPKEKPQTPPAIPTTTAPAAAPTPVAHDAAELKALEQLDADRSAQPKPGAEAGAGAAPAVDLDLKVTINGIATLASKAWAPNWGVTTDEIEAWSSAAAACAEKWFPDGKAVTPELALVGTTLMVVLPRLLTGTPLKIVQKKPPADAGQQPRG